MGMEYHSGSPRPGSSILSGFGVQASGQRLLKAPLALAYWMGIAGREERNNGCARILTFHGTPRHRAAELEHQLRYLRRQFEIVPLRSLAASIAAPSAALDSQLVLTFDDGLRSNITVAFPILKKLRIPATFFVCPGLIEQKKWLWPHEVRQRLLSVRPGVGHDLAGEFGAPCDAGGFVEWMKTLDLASRRRVEDRVREATRSYVPSAAEREDFDLADWDELRQLDPALLTIGSHTLTHPILPVSSAREIEVEVGESRHLIEARLQRTVDLFCYPNGDQNPAVLDCVRKHYRAAVTGSASWVRVGCDPHLLPRVGVCPGVFRLAWNLHRLAA